MRGLEKVKVKAQKTQAQIKNEVVIKVRTWKFELKLAKSVKQVDLGCVRDYPCPSKKELD